MLNTQDNFHIECVDNWATLLLCVNLYSLNSHAAISFFFAIAVWVDFSLTEASKGRTYSYFSWPSSYYLACVQNGCTALLRAAHSGHLDAAHLLLKHGANADWISKVARVDVCEETAYLKGFAFWECTFGLGTCSCLSYFWDVMLTVACQSLASLSVNYVWHVGH